MSIAEIVITGVIWLFAGEIVAIIFLMLGSVIGGATGKFSILVLGWLLAVITELIVIVQVVLHIVWLVQNL